MACEEMAEHVKVLSIQSVPNDTLHSRQPGVEAMITYQSCVFPEPS